MAENGRLYIPNFTQTTGKDYYNVQDCDYEFSLPCDNNYKPSTTECRGGLINFSLLSLNESNTHFHEWMFNSSKRISGRFEFDVSDGKKGKLVKTVLFQNAYCIRLSEYFSNDDALHMLMRITISAASIDFRNGVTFFNKLLPTDKK